jgi:hypothetical protein
MNGLEIAAIITAIGGFIGIVGALAINAKRIDDLKKQVDESRDREGLNRRDIIILGKNFAMARTDNDILAAAFNVIWLEFYEVTGKRPKANLEMLKRLTTLQQNATGRLSSLSNEMIEAIRRA